MKPKHLVKRRNVTLIEMMIVMFLIAMITGVIAYNYRGSLDEGKSFKTKQAMSRIENILNYEAAQDPSILSKIDSGWKDIVSNSSMVSNAKDFMKDGWGGEFRVSVQDNVVTITSDNYDKFQAKKGKN